MERRDTTTTGPIDPSVAQTYGALIMAALTGLLANPETGSRAPLILAREAITIADAVLAELGRS